MGGSDGDGLPSAGPRGSSRYGSIQAADRDGHQAADSDDGDSDQARDGWELSTLGLICLTVGLAGAQLTWTVEMAYVVSTSSNTTGRANGLRVCGADPLFRRNSFGTPYLLSLGLSKQATSLVWLAGPLSGLIVQPTIGQSPRSAAQRASSG